MEKKIKSGWRVKKEKEPEYAYGFQRRRRTDMRNRKQKIKYILLLCVFSMFLIASCKRSETGKTVESKEVINAQWENAAHTPYGKYRLADLGQIKFCYFPVPFCDLIHVSYLSFLQLNAVFSVSPTFLNVNEKHQHLVCRFSFKN
jgi:hypothetical protein